MLLEAKGQWQQADDAYDAILAAAPAFEPAHKRKVALLRRVAVLRASSAAVLGMG